MKTKSAQVNKEKFEKCEKLFRKKTGWRKSIKLYSQQVFDEIFDYYIEEPKEKKATINQFGDFLNSRGFEVEIDSNELWAMDWLTEHSFKDVLELFNDFQNYLKEEKND